MSDNSIPTPPPAPGTPPQAQHPGAAPVGAPPVPPAPASPPLYGAQPSAAPAEPHSQALGAHGQVSPNSYVQPAPNVYGQPAPSGYAQVPPNGYGPSTPGTAMQPATGYPAAGYAPGYGAPAYAPRPNNGVAVAAMVCGIVGVVFGWATFFIILPVLVSVAAVILGHVALSQLKKTPAVGGRGMAITGLVLGYIPIALTAILLVLAIIAAVTFGAFTIPFIWNS